MTNEKIKIELTAEECEVFKWTMENYNVLKEAKDKLRPGSLVMHFKNDGKLGKYEFHLFPQKCKNPLTM